MIRAILVLWLGLCLAGCSGAQMRSLVEAGGAIGGHLACGLECVACIQAIHGEGGEGFDEAVADQGACAQACATCAGSMAVDLAVIGAAAADAGGADVDVTPEPLPPAEVAERVRAAAEAYPTLRASRTRPPMAE